MALVRVEDRDFPTEVTVSDAQYVYRTWTPADGVTSSTSQPYFAVLIGEERYCGTSGTTTRPVNSFCIEHYVEHPEEPETEAVEDTESVGGTDAEVITPTPEPEPAPQEPTDGEETPDQNDPEVE